MTAVDNAPGSRRPPIGLLGALAAAGPLALSIHVQSIPTIAAALQTDYVSVQLTVSLYLLVFASAQLFVGPLSDKIGRRPVILAGIVLMGLASLGAALADTVEMLVAMRVCQALGACATLVVPRAVVQDIHSGSEAARKMSLVAMIQSMAPLTAPVIGGVLDAWLGWRAIFAFLALFSGALGLWAAFLLAETRPLEAGGASAPWREICARYGRLLVSRVYVGYTLAFAAGTSGFFGFLAVGPALFIGELGLAPLTFSILLTVITAQFAIANYVAGRLIGRIGVDRTLVWGALLGVAAAAALLALSPALSVPTLMLPMLVYAFSNGMLFPNAMAGAVGVDRRIAGTAASFAGFGQLGLGAVTAFVISALPTDTVLPYGIALVMLALLALTGTAIVHRGRGA